MEPEPAWGSKNLNNKPEEYSSSTEREARSIALEKAYVHDVYQQIASHFSDSRYRAWPKVKQFLLELEPGSIVCDVGCGNGKYLDINPSVYKIGIDRCSNLTGAAREKNHEVLISDNLNIPFRDECFDAVVSIAVIHHFATTERRVAALKELARVLRIGGRLMVSVWAMEQRHRRFESQDVLVPWNRPMTSSSDDKTSSIERDLNSTTTTTSDDDAATHYHAYTQTSDSEHSYPSCSVGCRKRGRIRHRGRSIDPTCPSSSQSSSDLSSPNESCYSFVRRALQKLAGTRRNRGGRRPWFLQGLDIPVGEDNGDHLGSMDEDVGDGLEFRNNMGNQPGDNFMPIELRQLESTDFVELFQLKNEGRHRQRGMLFSDVLYPRRRRTLETTSEIQQTSTSIVAQPKSKSLSDLFGLIPVGILRSQRKSTEDVAKEKSVPLDDRIDVVRSTSSLSGLLSSNEEIQFPDCVRHKSVQTESVESLDANREKYSGGGCSSSEIIGNYLNNSQFRLDGTVTNKNSGSTPNLTLDFIETNGKKLRPVLVKQKQSIGHGSPDETSIEIGDQGSSEENSVRWGEIQKSVRDLPELRPPSTLQVPPTSGRAGVALGSTFWKQSSLNEELIYSERLREKEKLKQNIQKQCSLNEELIYKRTENTRWDQMKEAFLNSSNVKCLQLIKNGISNRFRGGESQNQSDISSCGAQSPSPTFQRQSTNQTSSIRNGIVRMLQNWKQGEDSGASPPPHGSFLGARRGSKESTARRGLFPPFFLRRSSAGSLNLNKGKDFGDPNVSAKVLSPPHLIRRPSENEIFHEGMGNGNGNKLIPGVRHVRKLSREEGSDSSKDSSFQSDTSVDSEDSFASVIFIPKAASMEAGNEGFVFNTETRANSTDSDRSPKSPGTRLSPPNHNLPKSPSPLASEILRRRSPEVSPTKINLYGTANKKEVTKFIFDETATQVLSGGSEFVCSNKEELPLSSIKVSVFEPQEEKALGNETEDIHVKVPVSQKKKVERIEVLRKPGVISKGNKVTRQLVRRSLPKALAVELYNPETEDADTSDTSSSSPNSVSSVVSVVNEDNWPLPIPTTHQLEKSLKDSSEVITESIEENLEGGEDVLENKSQQPIADFKTKAVSCGKEENSTEPNKTIGHNETLVSMEESTNHKEHHHSSKSLEYQNQKSSSASILEAAANVVSSFESLVSQSSPKARRKLTLAKLGSTSDWLSSLPSDISSSTTQQHHPPQIVKRTSIERRTAGEKLLLGDVKKYQPKGPDAKWPSSIMDESPTQTSKISDDSGEPMGSSNSQATAELSAKLLEEMEERDSLFDSLENLSSSRQHPSRNPSIDSSVRMSSTCSCSIRGGESFESWSSAKSSLTNSSSTQQKPSLPSIIPLPQFPSGKTSFSGPGSSGRIRHLGTSSKSSSQAGEDTENSVAENSTALTYHRYYHVFREGELDKLIEKYVQNLHIISSYYDHANWCIIAEKVQVWTI